eukprot:2741392-Pyramimonas_sp.AAC.1
MAMRSSRDNVGATERTATGRAVCSNRGGRDVCCVGHEQCSGRSGHAPDKMLLRTVCSGQLFRTNCSGQLFRAT